MRFRKIKQKQEKINEFLSKTMKQIFFNNRDNLNNYYTARYYQMIIGIEILVIVLKHNVALGFCNSLVGIIYVAMPEDN